MILAMALAAALAAAAEPVRHFAPQALYGHINGGAELFLEFGFVGLDVQGGVESYRMADAAAALGVYLAKCGVEAPWDEVRARNTGGDYQLMAVKGTLFLIVKNPDGDPAARPEMIATANALLDREAEAPPLAIWDQLPAEGRIPGSEFLFRGRFALDPVFTFGEGDVLQIEGRALGAGARYAERGWRAVQAAGGRLCGRRRRRGGFFAPRGQRRPVPDGRRARRRHPGPAGPRGAVRGRAAGRPASGHRRGSGRTSLNHETWPGIPALHSGWGRSLPCRPDPN